MLRLELARVQYDLRDSFRISRGVITCMNALAVTLECDGVRGRGEAVGVGYRGETAESMWKQLESVRPCIESGINRAGAQSLLGAGGARNALDSALWDLEAKRTGRRAWELANLPEPQRIPLTATLSLDTPEAMRIAAQRAPAHSALKLKLGHAAEDLARVRAVREGVPDSRLLVDANGGWSLAQLDALAPALAQLGVEMIEQPLARGADQALSRGAYPVRLCADESCDERRDLEKVVNRYDMVNIKLDKTGGLTEALEMIRLAAATGLSYMVGCMIESSLGLAPATLLARNAAWCDLDGPLYLARDHLPRLPFGPGVLGAPPRDLWG